MKKDGSNQTKLLSHPSPHQDQRREVDYEIPFLPQQHLLFLAALGVVGCSDQGSGGQDAVIGGGRGRIRHSV